MLARERSFLQTGFHFEGCDENHREINAQVIVSKILVDMECTRPMLLTPAKVTQRSEHFCACWSMNSYCYEGCTVSSDSSSLSLGGESIRKFDFWIGVFLSGTSGSIQKSTSGSIRIYPQKTGNTQFGYYIGYSIKSLYRTLWALVIESSKSEYRNIRLSDIRISAKSYIRVGPYYPKPILEQRIIGSIFEHERI